MLKQLLLLSIFATGVARADDAAVLHCRAAADAAARLACYDAMPVALGSASAGPAAASGTVVAAAAAPVAAPSREQAFGAASIAKPAQQEELTSVQSYVVGHVAGWRPNSRIKLANGQVWRVVDGSSGDVDADNPKVTVSRGLSRAYFLQFEGKNQFAVVSRVE